MRAEAAGDLGPWRQQAILGRTHWDAEAPGTVVCDYVVETLASPDAVLVIVYQAERSIEIARHGRSYAAVQVCQCEEDGQYRYALDFWGSLRGFCGPIKGDCPGYISLKSASDAGREEMLRKFPTPQAYDPERECRELVAMRAQIEAGVWQPSLF